MSFSASHSQVIVADDAPGNGWVACTTDSILASKDALFDVLITMPAARTYTTNRGKRTRRAWPIIVESSGPGGARGDRVRIRATQRDLRRFRALRAALARISPPTPPQQPQQSQPQPISADSKAPASTITTVTATDSSASPPPGRNHSPPSTPSPLRPLQRTTSSIALTAVTAATAAGTAVVHATAAAAAGLAGSGLLDAAVAGGDFAALDDPVAAEAGEPSSGVVEPSSWAALAYAGFMWWASAGEQGRRDEKSERIADERLLADLGVAAVGPVSPATVPRQVSRPGVSHSQGQQASGSGIDLGGGATARRGADTGTGSKAAGSGGGPGPSEAGTEADPAAAAELAIISYFHRLTTSMLGGASDLVLDADAGSGCSSSSSAASSAPLSPEGGSSDEERYRDFGGPDDDGDDDENAALLSGAAREEITAGDRRPGVRIDSDALTRLGLDVWSKADGIFARELIGTYFGRRAWVERKRLEVCGLRIC